MIAYLLDVLSLIALYCVSVAALDLVAGRAGLVSACHAALFGVGAYVAGAGSLARWPLLAIIGGAVALPAVLGAVIGSVAGRVRAEYFLIVSFGFQVIASAIFVNWTAVTRGPMGISGVRRVASSPELSASLLILTALTVLWALTFVGRSPFGRLLTAVRDDEVFANSMGKNAASIKLRAFALSAAVTGVGGCLFAMWGQYIAPASFDFNKSVLLLAMLILGGAGTTTGVVAGASILVVLPEVARLVVGGPIAANLQGMLYGVVLIFFVSFRPTGLFGRPIEL